MRKYSENGFKIHRLFAEFTQDFVFVWTQNIAPLQSQNIIP